MLTCSNPAQRFENIKAGVPVTIKYNIKNTSEQEYTMKPSVSCGCSTPILPKKTIQPNEEMVMTVIFDSLGRSGIQEKNVYISYEDAKFGKQRLLMKFVVDVHK